MIAVRNRLMLAKGFTMRRIKLYAAFVLFFCSITRLQAQSSSIEVATVKPSDPDNKDELFTVHGRHFVTINTPVSDLLRFAYGLSSKQIEGEPEWTARERFDLDALTTRDGAISDEQMREMTQELLVQRFHLRFHREKKELAVYALTVAKGGPKLTKTQRSPHDNTDFYGPRGELIVKNATMQAVATGLSRGMVDRPVDDQTGLSDRFDFDLKWNTNDAEADSSSALPGFFKAFEEELGLKLKPTKALMTVLVIDGVSRPSAN
jgi:uncharacterized protein (TIGR03435 family)